MGDFWLGDWVRSAGSIFRMSGSISPGTPGTVTGRSTFGSSYGVKFDTLVGERNVANVPATSLAPRSSVGAGGDGCLDGIVVFGCVVAGICAGMWFGFGAIGMVVWRVIHGREAVGFPGGAFALVWFFAGIVAVIFVVGLVLFLPLGVAIARRIKPDNLRTPGGVGLCLVIVSAFVWVVPLQALASDRRLDVDLANLANDGCGRHHTRDAAGSSTDVIVTSRRFSDQTETNDCLYVSGFTDSLTPTWTVTAPEGLVVQWVIEMEDPFEDVILANFGPPDDVLATQYASPDDWGTELTRIAAGTGAIVWQFGCPYGGLVTSVFENFEFDNRLGNRLGSIQVECWGNPNDYLTGYDVTINPATGTPL